MKEKTTKYHMMVATPLKMSVFSRIDSQGLRPFVDSRLVNYDGKMQIYPSQDPCLPRGRTVLGFAVSPSLGVSRDESSHAISHSHEKRERHDCGYGQ